MADAEIEGFQIEARLDVTVRFWAKVDKDGPISILGTKCWVWTAAQNGKGYGIFAISKRNLVTAHGFSYFLHSGEFQRGVDHRCHNCVCVNPDHLRVLTNKQNNENRGGLNRNNTSGVRGVHWDRSRGKWVARVTHHRRLVLNKYFVDLAEAEMAVITKRNEVFTHNDLDRVS